MKKQLIISAFLLVGMLCCGCNSTSDEQNIPEYEAISLTQEEEDILAAMGADIQTIANSEFAANITAITEHTHDYIGQVYQFEGTYSMQDVHGENTPYLIQKVTNDGNETEVGLPLRYLEKDVVEGTPVRVTAIVGVEDHDGHTHAVLEVVAIESIQ